jgi:hypothetical protein
MFAVRLALEGNCIRFLSLALVAFGLFSSAAEGQSVSIQDTTSGNFYVGDYWTLTVMGGGYSDVEGCTSGVCEDFGLTDQNGAFSINGQFSSDEVGEWQETWYVGGVEASPAPLSFYVSNPPPPLDCTPQTSPFSPATMSSTDYYDNLGAYEYTSAGSVEVVGSVAMGCSVTSSGGSSDPIGYYSSPSNWTFFDEVGNGFQLYREEGIYYNGFVNFVGTNNSTYVQTNPVTVQVVLYVYSQTR